LTTSMANAKYSAYSTGALFDPDAGAGSVLAGTSNIPRSIASDGRRWVLFFHVIIHILAIAANVVNTVLMNRDFAQSQVKVASIVATAMHGAGVLALLALAAAELKQVSFVVSMGLIYSFLVSALIATAVTATFTFRSDDLLTDSHWLFYTSGYLQTLGFGLVISNSLNMAANGDQAIDKKAAPAPEPAA